MNDALLLPSCTPREAPTRISRLRHAARRWWQRLTMDEREAYLSNATDFADLERRLRKWDSGRTIRQPGGTWGW